MAGTKQQVEGIASFRANTMLATASDAQKSIDGINVLSLPDRSLAFCDENESSYRYNQSLVGPGAPPASIQPLVGPGLWVQESSGGGSISSDACGDFHFFTGTPLALTLPGTVLGVLQFVTPAIVWTPQPDNTNFSTPAPGQIQYDGTSPVKVKIELTLTGGTDEDPPLFTGAFIAFRLNLLGERKLMGESWADTSSQLGTFGLATLNPGDIIELRLATVVASPADADVLIFAASATITCCCGGGGGDDGGVFASRISNPTPTQTVTDAAPQVIVLDTVDFDQLGIADLPNNALEITQPGKYLIGGYLQMDTLGEKTIQLLVDGAVAVHIDGGLQAATLSDVLELAPGATLQLACGMFPAETPEDVQEAHLTAALLNGGVGSGTASLQGSQMRQDGAPQPLPGGATTTIDFTVSDYDDLGIVDLAGNRFVIASSGRYLVGYQTTIGVDPTVSVSYLITQNGTGIVGHLSGDGDDTRTNGSIEIDLAAGDIIQSVVVVGGASPANDTDTSPLSNTPVLWIVRIR